MQYWLFNTDETEIEGQGKHAVMMRKQVVAAWGHCKGLGAEATMNRPNDGDVVFFYRSGFGFVGCASVTNQLSYPTNNIFKSVGEYSRPVVDLVSLPDDDPVTVAEIKAKTGYQVPYRQIMGRILNQEAANYLLKRFKFKNNPSRRSPTPPSKGGFQPDPVLRKKVEKAAVRFVEKKYERNGWSVRSVELEKVGYDLHCTKDDQVECVEVKGTSGATEQFVITANEFEKAKSDPRFVLFVVTNALNKPKGHQYSGPELIDLFKITPLQYRVSKK